jgi:hypothetical protein
MRHKFAIAKQRKLLEAARQHVIQHGATRTDHAMYYYQLHTKVGWLWLHFTEGDAIATVFCRFNDPARALPVIGEHHMNKYSGKWNHHWDRQNGEAGLDWFKAQINMLMRGAPK